jgi:hypothetical protein
MASQQLTHMNELYASIKERLSRPDIQRSSNKAFLSGVTSGRVAIPLGTPMPATGRRWSRATADLAISGRHPRSGARRPLPSLA